jgi:hypothetical protein
MAKKTKVSKPASKQSALRQLTAAKKKAEAIMIAHFRKQQASEEKMLRSYLKTKVTPKNKNFLKLGKKVCMSGIKAWKLSIKAFRNDIKAYESRMKALQRT